MDCRVGAYWRWALIGDGRLLEMGAYWRWAPTKLPMELLLG